jgi:hypothetical protein
MSERLPQMIAQQRPAARDAVTPIEQAKARPQGRGLAELAFEAAVKEH